MRVYGVQLSFNNMEEVMLFPINPASIEISESGQGKTYDVSGLGEINVIKNRKLTEYSFSGLFPAQWYPFVSEDEFLKTEEATFKRHRLDVEKNKQLHLGMESNNLLKINLKKLILNQDAKRYDPLQPVEYIKLIEKWMASKRPVRFIFSSSTYDINTAVSIESFQWEEAAGGGGDIEYSIKLMKYIFYGAKKVSTETTSDGGKVGATSTDSRPNDKQQDKTYTMIAGDSLWSVAKKKLGNGTRWKEIQTLNNIKDSELKRLPIGKVLKLP
ncbi:MAG: LysM peptidoglycan-binding domain-containing protein [Candidatus Pristimantibacillus lignocellulolyticus]|uniref:LysM peptidoglycan-binding domain-containing protein n=1 Tax=Candidatus Pristimantibacillus lignocellulolyticus TaxID=2994561 RepID=A0A9J6ZER1_9BACL|nr:MAG: LysM peptidoglycan-binding domain-containing protein [Candidatus Pristimantibacillus lignocellulolyticus]